MVQDQSHTLEKELQRLRAEQAQQLEESSQLLAQEKQKSQWNTTSMQQVHEQM